MKKILSLILVATLVCSLCACSSNPSTTSTTKAQASAAETADIEAEATLSEEEQLEADRDELSAIGDVEVENGILTVAVTVPSDFIGEVTQEELDQKAGDTYVSATLNDDGSVTYKMTKSQHKKMLDGIVESIDSGLQDMVDDESYSFTSIKHNDDYTQFDVTISGTELNLADSFATLGFYLYGSMYGIFSGHRADNVIVNYYDADGNLISTGDSDNLGNN